MNKDDLFRKYKGCISDLLELIESENDSQNAISQEEQNAISAIEQDFRNHSTALQQAKHTITAQYRNVRESCVSNAGIRSPEAQRPAFTDVNWQECVRIQEYAAREIQEWFAIKKKQAIEERQRKLREEANRQATREIIAAEEERKRKEEAEALKERQGATLLEEMKRKYRQDY